MKKIGLIALAVLFVVNLQAQEVTAKVEANVKVEASAIENKADSPEKFAESITKAEMQELLTVIASDDFEGRETGSLGLNKAADFISRQFKQMGIDPLPQLDNSYYQPVPFNKVQWGEVKINANGKEFNHMRDFYCFAGTNQDMPKFDASEVVFLGYGIDDDIYSDYDGMDVKGKVLLVYSGEPKDKEGNYIVTGTKKPSKWGRSWRSKVATATEKGAKTILFIEPNTQKNISRYSNWLIEPSISLIREGNEKKSRTYVNNIFISPDMVQTIAGKKAKKIAKARKKISKKGVPQSFVIATNISIEQNKVSETVYSNNILGYIQGSDPQLANEVIVVSAHYDHLGKRGDGIYNGADDNGSGTTTVIEVAEAFMNAKKANVGPRRSVLFLLVCGEEKGLLGSEHYANNPIFSLDNTVANVNVDMVGRVDKDHEDNPKYIYVIGSNRLSTELHDINEAANKQYTNIELNYKYNDKNDPNRYYERSDHYNFAERGIPSIFYFSGTHKDYHKTSDTVDKINFEKMEVIGRLIFHTTWELANRDKRIEVDVKE